MKNLKTFSTFILGILFLNFIVFLSPTNLVSAAVNVSSTSNSQGVPASISASATNFCASLPNLLKRYQSNDSSPTTSLNTRLSNEAKTIENNRQRIDTVLQTARKKDITDRQKIYSGLQNKAKTDSEQQAVKTFKTNIEAAVVIRDSAVDSAVTAYRSGLDKILAAQQALITSGSTSGSSSANNSSAFRAAAVTAIQTAITQCSSGADPKTVSQTLSAALKAANNIRSTSTPEPTSGLNPVTGELQTLTQTRNAAVQVALQNYQSALETAVNALKTAFSQTPTPCHTVLCGSPASSSSSSK